MSKEISPELFEHQNHQNELDNKIDFVFKNLPNLIQDNVSDKLLTQIGSSIKEKRLVIFVGNHQGYIESEIWVSISKRLSDINPEFKGLYLPYSEPATNSNVGEFLKKRQDYYIQNKLFLLPVVRDTDETSEKYSQYVTLEMRTRSRSSMSKMAHASRNQFAIVALPEGSIKAGRINPDTGEIFGMQKPSDKTFLDLIFKSSSQEKVKINKLIHKTDLVPLGIDGSHKVLSSDNYQFSEKLPLWLKEKEKVITINSEKLIRADKYFSLIGTDQNVVEVVMRDEVAPLLSPISRGIYCDYNRTNLDPIV